MPLFKQAHGAGARGQDDGRRPGLPPHTQQHRVQRQGQRPLQLQRQGPLPERATTQRGAPQRARKKKTATPSLEQGPVPQQRRASLTAPPRPPAASHRRLDRPTAAHTSPAVAAPTRRDRHARTTGDRPPPVATRRRLGALTGTPPPRAGTASRRVRALPTHDARASERVPRAARGARGHARSTDGVRRGARRAPPRWPTVSSHLWRGGGEGSEGRPAEGAVAAWLARPDGSALSNVTMCSLLCKKNSAGPAYLWSNVHDGRGFRNRKLEDDELT